jgi:hypothetical protein
MCTEGEITMKRETKYRKAIYELGYSLYKYEGSWHAQAVNDKLCPQYWSAGTLQNLHSSLKGFYTFYNLGWK